MPQMALQIINLYSEPVLSSYAGILMRMRCLRHEAEVKNFFTAKSAELRRGLLVTAPVAQ